MASIGIVLGSKSDLPCLEAARKLLDELEVGHELRILSAHRTPEEARRYAQTARERGIRVIVAVAGMAAHLGGVLAASAQVPVLGVPARGGALGGFDALLSMSQMPAGLPVATFAIGRPGATNAALFACQMLALGDDALAQRIDAYRARLADEVRAADRALGES